MPQANKGTTFRALFRHFRMKITGAYIHSSLTNEERSELHKKVARGLENAQIRHGELQRTPNKLTVQGSV